MAERYFEGMEGETSNEEDLLRAKEIITELLELPGGTAREAFSNLPTRHQDKLRSMVNGEED